MERRGDPRVRRQRIGQRAAPGAGRIEDEHRVAVVIGNLDEAGEHVRVLGRADTRDEARVDEAVAEVAAHTVAVGRIEQTAVRLVGMSRDDAERDVAAQAVIPRGRDVLIRRRQLREEERITAGMRHQASRPTRQRLGGRIVVTVAGGARRGRDDPVR
jgi:hypothetical protein